MIDIFKALTDPTRLRLLALLRDGECSVQELVEILGMGQSRVSRHLKILHQAGLVQVQRQGTWAYYQWTLADDAPLAAVVIQAIDQLPQRSLDKHARQQAMARRDERSRRFFDRDDLDWDRLARALFPVDVYRDRLLALVPEVASAVEIGIGSGGLLEALARRIPQVTGVDQSAAMLARARQRAAAAGVAVQLLAGDMAQLPLADGTCELAVLDMALHHAAEPRQVLQEAVRVLTPGGWLLLADLEEHNQDWMRERLADQWLGFPAALLTDWLEPLGFQRDAYQRVPSGEGLPAVFLLRARLRP